MTCTSLTSLSSFKSAFATTALKPGSRSYFEVKLVKGSNFKVGVALSRRSVEAAFSDEAEGWAYYSNGQLRHNSKSEGDKYGKIFRGKDTVGVYVDQVDGVIFFSKNGEVFRDAFKSELFTTSELYPA
eukprot:CAMPEP_0202965410 /NCGR_PEP_ID=MMETSP1396-20130829/9394_1 /ASSEMBLY_ACC=CAM_ASM_000872 /TAXON_ID= /ORGANISM="Pseudokeronopsis sp., Strain Brazil" /LENGTH=127 /DNA_ID=CAMNT_0049688113 /DNA_START=246 /DNA_END=625 /DNA_ORIENTATION=-